MTFPVIAIAALIFALYIAVRILSNAKDDTPPRVNITVRAPRQRRQPKAWSNLERIAEDNKDRRESIHRRYPDHTPW